MSSSKGAPYAYDESDQPPYQWNNFSSVAYHAKLTGRVVGGQVMQGVWLELQFFHDKRTKTRSSWHLYTFPKWLMVIASARDALGNLAMDPGNMGYRAMPTMYVGRCGQPRSSFVYRIPLLSVNPDALGDDQ